MAKHVATKVEAGHYIYRNHHIYHETSAEGPCGTERPYWSISGEIGGPDEDSGHAELPQLQRLSDCKEWLDAYLDGDVKRKQAIERGHFRSFRSDREGFL